MNNGIKPALTLFCDFDGTITIKDTIDTLLTRLARPEWLEIEARWVAGEIGSRECMARQIPLIQGGWQAIQDVLDTVEIDPSFPAFVAWAKRNHYPVYVVSEGIEQVIRYILNRHEIVVDGIWANQLTCLTDKTLTLAFPHAPQQASCLAGLCKCQVLDYQGTRRTTVVVGDGFSDRCWASQADVLFAKAKLKQYCVDNQIAHQPFQSFYSVQLALEAAFVSSQPMQRLGSESATYVQFQPDFSRFITKPA